MSAQTYVLINGASAVQTIAAVPAVDGSNASAAPATNFNVAPDGPDASSHAAPASQGYQVTVTGNPGQTVSCSVQIVASNDGINFAALGVVNVASGVTTATGLGAAPNSPYKYFGAYVTAISGTGAKVKCVMCA